MGAGNGSAIELVHPVDVSEIEQWTRRIAATFLGDPNGPRVSRQLELLRRAWSPERAWAARCDGQIVATFATLDRRVNEALEPLPHNLLVHDGPDGADGIVAWTSTRDSQLLFPRGVAEVAMLIAASPAAYRDIWAYLSGLDGIDEVQIGNRAVDEPVRWLLADARTLEATRHYDFLWLRILDPVAVLSARRYAADGELVLEIIDDTMDGYAAGRVRLSVQDGRAKCAAAGPGARVDVSLDQRRLASILLGGFTPGELALGGGVEEQTPGTCDRLRAMLAAPVAPWNATWF